MRPRIHATHSRQNPAPVAGVVYPDFAFVPATVRPFAELLQRLSPAERHVLERFMQGESDPQIGKRLKKTERTVSNQLANIEGKWHVHSRVELLALALNSWHQSHQSQKPPA